jgi:predicted metal-dependent peptidase
MNLIDSEKRQFEKDFLKWVEQIGLNLMSEQDAFFGYFFLNLTRHVSWQLTSPTALWFKGIHYHIAFEPLRILDCTLKQIMALIKHDILHCVAGHLARSKNIYGSYRKRISNMAMDIVVNQYLDNLPSFAITLERVNHKFGLKLRPFETMEYYAISLQEAFSLLEETNEEDESLPDEENNQLLFEETTHDIWNESDDIEENLIEYFTKQLIEQAKKGEVPYYLEGLGYQNNHLEGTLPWQYYLAKLVGRVESGKKKTLTRRNRRQPERVELRGVLKNHHAEIIVAIDSSASMSDTVYEKALNEVLAIIKGTQQAITIIECDSQIRRCYQAKRKQEVKNRLTQRGATRFTPVFEYANRNRAELVIYFTDGKGETYLNVIPKGYKILWVLTGKDDQLSLKNPIGVVKKLEKSKEIDRILDMKDVRSDGYSMNNQEPIF